MIFQPSSDFWRLIAVLPTNFCFEFGKETDHQVRASARSGFRSLILMRLGSLIFPAARVDLMAGMPIH
jgi:hypothetical protein